jgi:hypothetical protein
MSSASLGQSAANVSIPSSPSMSASARLIMYFWMDLAAQVARAPDAGRAVEAAACRSCQSCQSRFPSKGSDAHLNSVT